MTQSIVAAVDDMMFISKIRATAEHLGVEVKFAKKEPAIVEAIRTVAPSLVILDLNLSSTDPIALARALKASDETRAVRLLGFFSHVQTELMQQAKAAGIDVVIPRSAFASNLAAILTGEADET